MTEPNSTDLVTTSTEVMVAFPFLRERPRKFLIEIDETLNAPDPYGDADIEQVRVFGAYEVSTIEDRGRFQTVLFREAGEGPAQLELWFDGPLPTEAIVQAELAAGRFYPRP